MSDHDDTAVTVALVDALLALPPRRPVMRRALLVVVAAAVMLGLGCAGAELAGAGTGVQVIREKVILQYPVQDCGPRLLVNDQNGAPMAWVNCYGLYSGGDGGKMVGGLVCTTYGVTSDAACLTPEGELTLQATGPRGPYGPKVTLTARELAGLVRLAQRRGWK